MPLPKPHKGESQSDFMKRCMGEAYGDSAPEDRTQEQAVAMCLNTWREAHGKAAPPQQEMQRLIARWKQILAAMKDGLPSIAPFPGEARDDWMTRCQAHLAAHGREGGDATAHCVTLWEQSASGPLLPTPKHATKQNDDADALDAPEPDEDESREEYMDRCVAELSGDDGMGSDSISEDDAEEACRAKWEERAPPAEVVHKAHAATVNGMDFILSDETPDRFGDVISATGWDLTNFKKNPIALWAHRSDFPIGRWRNLRVEGPALRGKLEMAPLGTSDRIDELRRLIDAGILKAVSVGFRAIESKPMTRDGRNTGGLLFTKQELVETSLVSVPANPNALSIAKSLQISPETMNFVFAEPGRGNGVKRRGFTGEPAKPHVVNRRNGDMSLSQRIQDSQDALNGLRDQLTAHLANVNDENVSDADMEITNQLNAKIAQREKGLASLKEAERRLAADTAKERDGKDGMHEMRMPARYVGPPAARPFTIPAKKLEPQDYVWRTMACLIKHHSSKGRASLRDVMLAEYGEDEGTAAVLGLITRDPAASAPATTGTTGWAAELVAIVMGEFYKALIPRSIFPRLAAKGSSFTFGRYGIVTLPMRSITPTVAGSFVGEGAPIPVRQGQFVTQQLTPKKMAVITTFTREIAEHSTPAIEGILRDAVLDDTSVAIDTVLLDSNPATAIRPPGLLNGITVTTATAGGGFAAVLGDVKALTNALITATRGNFRQPVWIMSPALAVSLSLVPTTGAQALPFREEVSRGFLMGIPILESTTVAMGTLILVDAADFASVTGEDARWEVSDQAVLHMEDTTPLQIVSGSPGTAASPTRSLWQTDTIGLRMIMPLNWTTRRPSVAYTTAVTWQ
jgi:HK97 family phage prohead protease/HK97 family phage major capsid protein